MYDIWNTNCKYIKIIFCFWRVKCKSRQHLKFRENLSKNHLKEIKLSFTLENSIAEIKMSGVFFQYLVGIYDASKDLIITQWMNSRALNKLPVVHGRREPDVILKPCDFVEFCIQCITSGTHSTVTLRQLISGQNIIWAKVFVFYSTLYKVNCRRIPGIEVKFYNKQKNKHKSHREHGLNMEVCFK